MKIDINFNWKNYIESYPDLQKSGINSRRKAWFHWIKYGNTDDSLKYLLFKPIDKE